MEKRGEIYAHNDRTSVWTQAISDGEIAAKKRIENVDRKRDCFPDNIAELKIYEKLSHVKIKRDVRRWDCFITYEHALSEHRRDAAPRNVDSKRTSCSPYRKSY